MADTALAQLQTAIQRQWPHLPSTKAKPYVHAFTAAVRSGTKITAKVVGNHGTYTVSIQFDTQGLTSEGQGHHAESLRGADWDEHATPDRYQIE
jgi:hypothetical protein